MEAFPQYTADMLLKTSVRRFRWLEQESQIRMEAENARAGIRSANAAGNQKAYAHYAELLDKSGW